MTWESTQVGSVADAENVYVLGRSIGGTPAIELATKRNPAALLLVSPFLSIKVTSSLRKQLLKDHYGLIGSLGYLVMKSGFDNESKLKFIKSPTLLIHGKKDELISPEHSIKMFGRQL